MSTPYQLVRQEISWLEAPRGAGAVLPTKQNQFSSLHSSGRKFCVQLLTAIPVTAHYRSSLPSAPSAASPVARTVPAAPGTLGHRLGDSPLWAAEPPPEPSLMVLARTETVL